MGYGPLHLPPPQPRNTATYASTSQLHETWPEGEGRRIRRRQGSLTRFTAKSRRAEATAGVHVHRLRPSSCRERATHHASAEAGHQQLSHSRQASTAKQSSHGVPQAAWQATGVGAHLHEQCLVCSAVDVGNTKREDRHFVLHTTSHSHRTTIRGTWMPLQVLTQAGPGRRDQPSRRLLQRPPNCTQVYILPPAFLSSTRLSPFPPAQRSTRQNTLRPAATLAHPCNRPPHVTLTGALSTLHLSLGGAPGGSFGGTAGKAH